MEQMKIASCLGPNPIETVRTLIYERAPKRKSRKIVRQLADLRFDFENFELEFMEGKANISISGPYLCFTGKSNKTLVYLSQGDLVIRMNSVGASDFLRLPHIAQF